MAQTEVKSTRDFRRAQRAYERKRQQYALNVQAEAQAQEIARHKQRLAELQKGFGAAQGDEQKLNLLKQAYLDEQNLHNSNMESTANLEQYYSGFDTAKFDKEQKEKKIEGDAKEKVEGTGDTSSDDKQTKSEPTGGEHGGDWSTALANTVATYMQKKAFGTPVAPNIEHLQRQAEMHDKQAGDEQKNAQQNFHVANRNYRVEAEKNAASQAAAENAQKINNMGNVSAGAAALERGVKAADYNTHMQRQDQQRAEGVKNQREMWGSKQTAEEEHANAAKENHDYLDTKIYNNMSDALSLGGRPDNERQQVQQLAEQPPEQEPAPAEPQPEQPNEPSKNGWTYYDVQQAINILYSETGREGMTDAVVDSLIKKRKPDADPAVERARLAPLVEEMRDGKEQEYVTWLKSPEVRNGNVSVAKSTEQQAERGDTTYEQEPVQQQANTTSDRRQKNIIAALSSIRF